jgi:hypothetical protein
LIHTRQTELGLSTRARDTGDTRPAAERKTRGASYGPKLRNIVDGGTWALLGAKTKLGASEIYRALRKSQRKRLGL